MRRILSALTVTIALLFAFIIQSPALSALTIDSARDCDSNAVIYCGALNFTELQNRYSQPGVSDIYSSFGISSRDINNIQNVAVEGTVTNKNNVWISKSSGLCPDTDNNALSSANQQAVQNNPNLCLVATNAMTAGRQNMSGSTQTSSGSTTFYKRPPSVSFASSSLQAFVVMVNHKFSYAIIASCGNPVIATPVPVKSPVVTPVPPKTSVTPTSAPTQTQTQSQSQSVTVNVPAQVQSATTTQPAAATKTLPNTGPGNVLILSGATTAIGSIGHWYYSRRNRRH